MSSRLQSASTTAQVLNDRIVVGRISAAMLLQSAADHIDSMEYNQRKASKLLSSLADMILAEALFESNLADIGFAGCTE